MLLSCYIMLIVWTTSFSFQRSGTECQRANVTGVAEKSFKLCQNCPFQQDSCVCSWVPGFLALLALLLWFAGLFWWASVPWTAQVLAKYSWHQYCDLSICWLWNQSIRHSVNWMKIQSLHGRCGGNLLLRSTAFSMSLKL